MEPVESLKVNGEEIGLYINSKPFVLGKDILMIPIKGLVDDFSVEVASEIAVFCSVQLIEVNSPSDDLHGVRAFALDIEEVDWRKYKETEEYNSAKQKLLDAVSMFFEAKKLNAKTIVERVLNNR